MATLTWQETLPSDGSAVGRSPDEIRAHIANTAKGLGVWTYWPGSGNGSEASAGELKPGASRPFYAAESAASCAGPQLLFLASDSNRLFYYTSNATVLVGTPQFMEHGTHPGTDTLWTFSGGTTPLAFSGSTTITFSPTYAVYPVVIVTSSISGVALGISVVTTGGATIEARDVSAPGTSCVVTWQALGLVAQ